MVSSSSVQHPTQDITGHFRDELLIQITGLVQKYPNHTIQASNRLLVVSTSKLNLTATQCDLS